MRLVTTVRARARERVLHRLRNPRASSGVCGFYHPDDQAALERLVAEGLATCWRGEFRDAGLLLGKLKRHRIPAPFAPAQQRGDG